VRAAASLADAAGADLCIFSTGKRASGKEAGILGTMKKFLKEVWPGRVGRFEKDTNEYLFFMIRGDLRKIKAFPSGNKRCVWLKLLRTPAALSEGFIP